MTRTLGRLCAALAMGLFFLAWTAPVSAHPHAFVEAYATFVFDEKGLAGIRERWLLDEMVSIQILELINGNFDGTLDAGEKQRIKDMAFINLKEYGYFTDIRIDGKPFQPEWAVDFSCDMDGGRMVYSFTIPCHVAATATEKTVKMAIYDQTFYTFVAYGAEGSPGIDPTADPLFADQSAPANPGDFDRFSQAVGLDEYQGQVEFDGPVDSYAIKSAVEYAPDMAYFFDQITPEAFVVRFWKK